MHLPPIHSRFHDWKDTKIFKDNVLLNLDFCSMFLDTVVHGNNLKHVPGGKYGETAPADSYELDTKIYILSRPKMSQLDYFLK